MGIQSDNEVIERETPVTQKVRQALSSLVSDQSRLGCIAGFALLYAWNLMGAITPGSVLPNVGSALSEEFVVGATSVSNALGYLIVAFALSRSKKFGGIACACAAVVCLASLVSILASCIADVPEWLHLACRVVSRLCAAAVTVAWLGRFARLEPRQITPCCLAGFLGAVGLALLALAFEGMVKQVFHALLLPLSMIVFIWAPDPADEGSATRREGAPSSASKFASSVWRVLVVFFVFGVVDWTVSICTSAPSAAWVPLATFACTVVVLLFLLGFSLVNGAALSARYVYKVVVPTVFAGLIAIVASGPSSAFGTVLVQTGYSCFDVFCLALFASVAARTGVRAEAALGLCRAVECSAPLVALLVMGLFGIGPGAEDLTRLLAAAGAFALLLSVLVDGKGVFESDGSTHTEDLPKPEAMLFAAQCEQAIRNFGLTPREGEVMSLIARGRSVPHIAGRLGISRSTAKTYVTRIYEKLGVSERQEMLDVIESLPVEG